MSLEEILFERLLSRYEKRFGTQPDITAATVDEAVERLRRDLAAMPLTARPAGGGQTARA
jgi:hypothetical protein